MFVYINNTSHDIQIPWAHYAEFAPAQVNGTDVLTGAPVTLSADTVVPAMTSLVVEYKR